MADYIDRQAVNDALDKTCDIVCQYSKKQRYAMCGACPLGSAYDVIENVPSADVQPVRHGVWVEENSRPKSAIFYCSECHGTAYDIQPTRDKTWAKRCRYAYCPNCGARMDGE